MRHCNIPVFIPHLGCPNKCVFCNQRTISGVSEFNPDSVTDIIDEALLTVLPDDEVEIAFFGGSFTGIDFDLMEKLLKIANGYIKRGRVKSIRCSTRPDYIDEPVLLTLKKYGVKVIELGFQSASDRVLSASRRGHDFNTARRAARMIVDHGFTLVGQMMIGLPESDVDAELKTADFIIECGASAARIYPTVVFRDTELCEMAENGSYVPLSLQEAVGRSALVYRKFLLAGISVIRVGLCASDNLVSDKTYHSGPNHCALGELVANEIYYSIIFEQAGRLELTSSSILKITVPKGSLSKALGQKKRNKLLLIESLSVRDVRFYESDGLKEYQVLIDREEGEKKCI